MNQGYLLILLFAVLFITNLVCFHLMRKDKKSAVKGEWRVKEKTLFISCACFGALGGVLGMRLLRHKTKHWYFKVFFPLMLVLQTAAVLFLVLALYGVL